MFSNSHNINYRKIVFNSFTIIYLTVQSVLISSQTAFAQNTFNLPAIEIFTNSIDTFYNNFSAAQIEEFKATQKHRWLNYLPSPGYSPFTGGFTLSLNLSAPITEIKSKQAAQQKIKSITQQNALTASDLKNEVLADYKAVEIAIYEFYSKDSLDYLTVEAFKLVCEQNKRSQITPTEFFAAQKNFQSWKVQRLIESNNINKSILQLFIKSKAAINTNDYGFKNLTNNDKTTTSK